MRLEGKKEQRGAICIVQYGDWREPWKNNFEYDSAKEN